MSNRTAAAEPGREKLAEALTAYAQLALTALAEIRRKDEVRALNYEVQRYVVDDFDYTEKGVWVTNSGVAREQCPLWHPTQQQVYHELRSTPVFREAARRVAEGFPDRKSPEWPLERLVDRIVADVLDGEGDTVDVGALVGQLLNELDRKPTAQKAVAELYDVVLLGCNFPVESQGVTYRLRPTSREDLERQHGHIAFGMPYEQGYPGGILEVSLHAKDHLALQKRFEEALSVLNLFRPMSVGYQGYRVESKAILARSSGTAIGGGRKRGMTPGRLYPDDDLVGFWKHVHPLIGQSLFLKAGQPPDSLQTAYGRYLDALWSPSVPQRVATAVMGLEALLSGKLGSSRYKLAVRTAKLLSQFGLSPLDVKSLMAHAYTVRSHFVHGKYFGESDRNRLAQGSGDLGRSVALLFDYLRICLVAFLVTAPQQHDFPALIDDALVDSTHDAQLDSLLADAKTLCKSSVR